jgi:hypothetical protein
LLSKLAANFVIIADFLSLPFHFNDKQVSCSPKNNDIILLFTVQFEYEEVESNDKSLMLTEVERLIHAFQHTNSYEVIILQYINVVTAFWRLLK